LEKIHTTCVYCGCGCGLFLHVENGRVTGVSSSPAHPLSRGRLCIKGWQSSEFIHHPDRLKTPLIRQSEQQVAATWEAALNFTSKRLGEIQDQYGPKSLAVLTSAKGTNEENYLLMKFARAALGTNNVDHVARLCHAPSIAGLGASVGSGAMTNPISNLASSDVILVVGSNTTEQHPLVASYILKAKSKGSLLIVADPRNTQIADLADIHLNPNLGADVAWLNGMLNVIIQEKLIDLEFISKRTRGFDDVKKTVSEYTPEIVEKISGLPAEMIQKAAIAFGSAKRGSIVYAMGITQSTAGTDNVLALTNLALATGNIGREGTGIYPLRGHQNVQGACDVGALPAFYTGYQKVSEYREKFEEAWGAGLPGDPGMTAMEIMDAAADGQIRGIYISGENPMMSYPDRNRIRSALESLDFLAVADIFPSETTELADVVFPVASFAEKDGTFTSTERRVQRICKVIAPLFDCRSEVEVICDLSTRLGFEMSYGSPKEIMDEIASLTPSYGGISYDRLGLGGIQWPCPEKDHPGTEILHVDTFPIGTAVFHPVEYKGPHEVCDQEYPMLLTTGRSLFHFHTGTMTRKTPLLDREVPSPEIEINSEDAKRLEIRNGWPVVVESRRGSLRIRAKISDAVPPGIVFIPFHFKEAPANVLTGQAVDPKSGIPALKLSAVRIRRADA
jgi:formate dehydrogenase alpha subunit